MGREEPSVADFRPSQGPEQNPICFLHGHAPGKKLCSPRECQLRWRGSGCIPQFWEPSAAGPKIPTPPSPPSWGAGRYGRRTQGRRPGRKKEDPPQGPLNQSRESRGEKLSPLALFPPVSREKRGPPPGRRPTGRCAPRPRKSPAHPQGTQYPAAPPPGTGREPTSQGPPCAGPNGPTYR